MAGDSSDRNEVSEELTAEEVAAAKRRSRMSSLTLMLIFLLAALAPQPWREYAPALLLIPIFYSLYNRLHRKTGPSDRTRIPEPQHPTPDTSASDPYSSTPRDPKDPRRYKPIG